jgi:hypothetical protein
LKKPGRKKLLTTNKLTREIRVMDEKKKKKRITAPKVQDKKGMCS